MTIVYKWKKLSFLFALLILGLSYYYYQSSKNKPNIIFAKKMIEIKENGKFILFPENYPSLSNFKTEIVATKEISFDLKAPATVAVRFRKNFTTHTIVPIFSSTDLSTIFSSYQQSSSLLRIARINYIRAKDLYDHGATTGHDLNDAASEKYLQEASLQEAEAKLLTEGFDPKKLKSESQDAVWIIADVPESETNIIKVNLPCKLEFPGLPGEIFKSQIEGIAETLNPATRKARVRVRLKDSKNILLPGMYGTLFVLLKDTGRLISKNALFLEDGKFYVFVKTNNREFEKREIRVSTETNDYIEILGGVEDGEAIVVENAYLLKGLSHDL